MALTIPATKWTFTCDRCGNTADFYHGMTTYSLTYLEKNSHDKRSFCSEICVQEIYRQEKEGK
jgi:predicted nucleic acid-binding Zn ribbon protein